MALTGDSPLWPRTKAQRPVIIAAALTTLVAAALASALAVFAGLALPRAVRHNLATASGTALVISGAVDASQAAQYSSVLPRQLSAALAGTPFAFYHALWSDPLGFVPGSLPATPGSTGRGDVPIAEAAAFAGIPAHAVLISGSWPGPPQPAGRGAQLIPAALPIPAAALLHVRTGAVLQLRDRVSGRLVRFRVTGLYRPTGTRPGTRTGAGSAAPYWSLNSIGSSGAGTAVGFTTYGPLAVAAPAFSTGTLAVGSGSWVAQPDMARLPDGQLGGIAARVSGLDQTLQQSSTLPSLTPVTSLPAVLDGTQSDLEVARSLLAICAVLVALLGGAALLVVARLLAVQREGESAMLTARGAARGQLARLALAEALPLCAAAAAAGGLAGLALAWLLATPGAGSVATAASSAWPATAVVAAGAVVIMLVPVLRPVTPGAARARRGRSAAIGGVLRAGGDVALIVLAVLAGWELRRYSAVSADISGGYGVDPVLVIAPALALAGGTVAALRLLPAGAKAGDRLAARGRRLTAALASWQISRQPVRQGGAALLVVLAVATGALVLAQRQSSLRSDDDQAAFTAGANVRVTPAAPLTSAQAAALVTVPGVRRAMPVAVLPATTTSSETVALDARQAADVTLLRADQSSEPPSRLFAAIAPAGPTAGLPLPGRPARIRLTAQIGPAGLAPVVVDLTAEDADGDAYQIPAGTLAADARPHTLTAAITGGAVYPLRLTAITASYTLPATRLAAAAVFTVDSVAASQPVPPGGPGGGAPPASAASFPGTALERWRAVASSSELAGVRATFPGPVGPSGMPGATSAAATAGGARTVSFSPGYGQTNSGISGSPLLPIGGQLTMTATGGPAAAVPGVATRQFLAANAASVGSTVSADVNGASVEVRIVAAVTAFPTVTQGGGALIVDLAALQDVLAAQSLPPAQATQWWLATARGQPPPGLAARLPAGTAVTSSAQLTAALRGDPVAAVPRQGLLAVAIAAVVLAITGFCVSIATGVRQRRAENALLAALGVPPAGAAGQLCLEKLMLSVPSALAGLALGAVLAELLVPAITLTTSATAPVPPVLIVFGWPQTVALAVAVAVIPVLAAGLAMARRP
ncbi:MAG: FtsX-like permease family protein, partial [Streptosporangiaceae bacterium]